MNCCLLLAVGIAESLWSGTGTVHAARQANKDSISSIRTAEIEYDVVFQRVPLRASELPDSRFGAADVKPFLHMVNLGRSGYDRLEIRFSAADAAWRTKRDDLRDLTALLAAKRLPEDQLVNLDRTAEHLCGAQASGLLVPRAGHLLVMDADSTTRNPTDAILRTPMETGCWHDELLMGEELTAEECLVGKRQLVRIARPTSDYVLYLDPAIGYRYRTIESYAANGRLVERKIADDYRIVDGVPYPFRHEAYKWDSNGELVDYSVLTVTKAAINRELPAGALELVLPAGTYLQDLRLAVVRDPRSVSRVQVRDPIVIRVGDLATVVSTLLQPDHRRAGAANTRLADPNPPMDESSAGSPEPAGGGRRDHDQGTQPTHRAPFPRSTAASPPSVRRPDDDVEIDPAVIYISASSSRRSNGSPTSRPVEDSQNPAKLVDHFVKLSSTRAGGVHIKSVLSDEPILRLAIEEQEAGREYLIRVSAPPGFVPPPAGRCITIRTDHPLTPSIRVPILATRPAGSGGEDR